MRRLPITLRDGQTAQLALRSQGGGPDVIYVHGSTFGCELSLFFRIDGVSWADALERAGFRAWGFDFVGYGSSSAYPASDDARGRGDEAAAQLLAVIDHVRRHNGGRPVALLAHSWGCSVAARAAAGAGESVASLALFAPVAVRPGRAPAVEPPKKLLMSAWAQYRRFIADVPKDAAPVLDDRHFDAWQRAYLATDARSAERDPPAVQVPGGPLADLAALWSGQALFDMHAVRQPSLIVHGEWDSLCNEADAAYWIGRLVSAAVRDQVLPRGTHLMHLESGRQALYAACNQHLAETHR